MKFLLGAYCGFAQFGVVPHDLQRPCPQITPVSLRGSQEIGEGVVGVMIGICRDTESLMSDILKLRSNGLLGGETGRKIWAGRRVGASWSQKVVGASHIKRLDGEVERLGEHAYSGGVYCEVWIGQWKRWGEGEVVAVEKVTLDPPPLPSC